MPEIYDQVKSNVTKAMKRGLVYFFLTTDTWTSRVNHSYITHTVHYINELWDLRCHVLDTTEITTEHMAVNLAEELQESLTRWNLLEDKVVAVTRDNARNIVKSYIFGSA